MYLKSIEVQGFKSFAHKIVFEFHNGITCIVGPNGSGKSNVADAVRWVLGEQSAKQLRGAKMEDVIFSGTESRKSQGFAYVALTMDNSDHKLPIEYDEVKVARRVYRSGESEYSINGTICRLKDVNEMFYDTGIGKEGYSIIGQGQIDKILSGKPEERRELFDEAAGIVKFKRRKSESIKKLENERQNLIRIEDILSELGKQVGPLEKQAEVAKEYLRLKEELKTYDINMFLIETKVVKEQLKSVEDKNEIAINDLESSKINYTQFKEQYHELDVGIEEISLKIEETKSSINEADITKGKLEGEINLQKEQINNMNLKDGNFESRIHSIQLNVSENEAEYLQLLEEKKKINSGLDLIKEDQERESEKLLSISNTIRSFEKEIEENKALIIDLLNEKSLIKTKGQRYETMLEQIQIRKAELNRKLLQNKRNETMQAETIDGLEKELLEINKKLAELEEKGREYTAEISRVHEINLKLEENRAEIFKQYHSEKSRLESLRNLTERYDGYGNSIRKVMERKETQKGIIGVVADIIKTEKKYETAIETALGGSIQNIVTDNENTAKDLIAYLKKNKFGRATFLPLDSIHGKSTYTNDKVLTEKGALGFANELVDVDVLYKSVASYLLGRILVVDDIDHALLIARKYNHTLRIVTLDGELLNAGGSMTGGAFKNAGNLLGRRREIEELEESVNVLEERSRSIQKEIEVNKAINANNRKELELLRESQQETYIAQTTAKMNLNHAIEEDTAQKEEYTRFMSENMEIEQQVVDIKIELEDIREQLALCEEKSQVLEDKVKFNTKELEAQRIIEAEQSKKAEELRLEVVSLSQKESFLLENIKRISRDIEKYKEEIVSLNSNKTTNLDEIKEKEIHIETIKGTIEESVSYREKLGETLKEYQNEKERLVQVQKESYKKREELSEVINGLDKEVFRLSNHKEKLEETLTSSASYMWEEYELTYHGAEEYANEEFTNASEMKKKIASLKGNIKELGTVNVNAIEDYKEVAERFDFLEIQHNDLIEAEKTLLKIIEDLDVGMRKQFKEKFQEIKIEFDKVFKELFGGGKATLELMEDEDILDAGIKIISQPPGKKLQNMMQLSGGEKALTAISLLFAIQNLKPSPFCLLDEIEAALDDSNVIRFAKYLNKLTKNTQFIVITHRRGTMNAADRLYGITMQEKGVSALVSVNLIEDDLEGK